MYDTENIPSSEYNYGFKDKEKHIFSTGKGINAEIVKTISSIKNEPEWMLDLRLKAFATFSKMEMPTWGVDLSSIDFNTFTYYMKANEQTESAWDKVLSSIRDTFPENWHQRLRRIFLAGVATQYDSEMVYHNVIKRLRKKILSSLILIQLLLNILNILRSILIRLFHILTISLRLLILLSGREVLLSTCRKIPSLRSLFSPILGLMLRRWGSLSVRLLLLTRC